MYGTAFQVHSSGLPAGIPGEAEKRTGWWAAARGHSRIGPEQGDGGAQEGRAGGPHRPAGGREPPPRERPQGLYRVSPVHATLPTMSEFLDHPLDPQSPAPAAIQDLIRELEVEASPSRRDHLRARLDLALAAYRADQEWRIFAAQTDRAAREANDAMKRHREVQAIAEANAEAAEAHATAANEHARALRKATWWLAASTAVLAVATVVLVLATARSGG